MANDDTFLEAIREQPDDDAPRLICADWLEEHGQPERAEFIRVQCDRARIPEGSPRWWDLECREKRLWEAHHAEWFGSLAESVDRSLCRRGFLELIVLEAERFLAEGPRLFRLEPIRYLRLADLVILSEVRLDLPTFFTSPLLERLTGLDLGQMFLGPEEMRILAESPCLTHLTSLNLNLNPLGAEGAAILRQAPFFPRLHSLYLSGCQLGATGVERLVETRQPVALRELNLSANNLGAAGVQALTAARSFYRGLTCLSLQSNETPAAGIRALAQ
ncbi:MAG: TIGR02996 domain-containing protein, partial [Gemmataceae bacterium]